MASKKALIEEGMRIYAKHELRPKDFEVYDDGWSINGWGSWSSYMNVKPLKHKIVGTGGTKRLARESLEDVLCEMPVAELEAQP